MKFQKVYTLSHRLVDINFFKYFSFFAVSFSGGECNLKLKATVNIFTKLTML